MGEAKRNDKKKSMEYFGGKADNLDQKTMAYLQGFIACAEQMANKKEDGQETAERNREDKKDGENMGSVSIPDKE